MDDFIKAWATEHPFLFFLLAYSVIHYGFNFVLKIMGRIFRMINIIVQGYPTAPLMDADGDIIHPKDSDA